MRHDIIDLVRGGATRADTPRRATATDGGSAAGARDPRSGGAAGIAATAIAPTSVSAPDLSARSVWAPDLSAAGVTSSGVAAAGIGDVTLRRRLARDARLAVRLVGLAYMLLWLITWWVLDHGAAVLGPGTGCRLQRLSDLVLWRCTDVMPIPVVADLVNGVLASTVWAPVVVMAAAIQPEVRLAAVAVIGLHLVGLPAALLIAVRFGARLCDRIARRAPADAPAGDPTVAARASVAEPADRRAAAAPVRAKRVPPMPRATFGLRQAIPS